MSDQILAQTKAKFLEVPLEPFRLFHAWGCTQGLHNFTGLDWEALRRADPSRLDKQPRPGELVPVIPKHMSVRQHVETACELQHPFAFQPHLEKDLRFAVLQSVQLGPDVQALRDQQFGILRKLSRALLPLDTELLKLRHVQHVPGFRPALIAACIIALQWPDTALPQCLQHGFPIVGDIPPSNIFRPIEPNTLPVSPLLGVDARDYVNQLESDTRVHPSAALILQESLVEQELGLLGPFQNRGYFDKKFGAGRWRPLKRHTVHQHDKERPIDDGKAGRHNECSVLSEAIVNQHPDFPVAVVKFWFQEMLRHKRLQDPSLTADACIASVPFLDVVAGTEDLWKGYRQNHPIAEHMSVNIITFVHPETRRRVYAQLYGLPFGLASSVNQFNRTPQLLTAIARRVLLMVCGHYFDDSIQFDFAQIAACHKLLFVRLLELFGVVVSHKKRQYMSRIPRFLGLLTDLSYTRDGLFLVLRPNPDTKERASAMLQFFLASRRITSGEAAKLRGLLNWLEMSVLGRPLTAAFSALIARQYAQKTASDLPHALELSLRYLLLALHTLPDRFLPIFPCLEPPVLIYTDASTEAPSETGMRLGFWIRWGGTVYVSAVDIPREAVERWQLRTTYINLLELLAAPVLALCCPFFFRNQSVLWFIDNQTALRSLIRSAARVEDINHLSLMAGLFFSRLKASPWYEWVPSHQNPSDPLSRDGWQDATVISNIRSGVYAPLHIEPPWHLLSPTLEFLSEVITALE